MAIIIRGKSECSICGDVLGETDDVVGTPHFIHDQGDPLWRFSDSGMHRECFLNWPDASAFRAAFDSLWPKLVPRHPRKMLPDGTIVDAPDLANDGG